MDAAAASILRALGCSLHDLPGLQVLHVCMVLYIQHGSERRCGSLPVVLPGLPGGSGG